jgi:hypothetical protein
VEEYALHLLGIDKKASPNQWPVANLDLAPALRKRESKYSLQEGEQLHLDLDEKDITAWTKHIAVIFESLFSSEHRRGSFPGLNGSVERGKAARVFLDLALRLKSRYARSTTVINRNPSWKAEHQRQARKYSRRRQV